MASRERNEGEDPSRAAERSSTNSWWSGRIQRAAAVVTASDGVGHAKSMWSIGQVMIVDFVFMMGMVGFNVAAHRYVWPHTDVLDGWNKRGVDILSALFTIATVGAVFVVAASNWVVLAFQRIKFVRRAYIDLSDSREIGLANASTVRTVSPSEPVRRTVNEHAGEMPHA